MKAVNFIFPLLLLSSNCALAELPPPLLTQTSVANQYQLSWFARADYDYALEWSDDLITWNPTGITKEGNDQTTDHFWTTTARKNFFRLSASTDLNGENSWVLPADTSLIDRIEGVCFSFDLQGLAELPTQIQIFKRAYQSPPPLQNPIPFELIGSITDFFQPSGERSVQGGCVWVADEGQYEVQVVIVDCAGGSITYPPRTITVGPGTGPSIAFADPSSVTWSTDCTPLPPPL